MSWSIHQSVGRILTKSKLINHANQKLDMNYSWNTHSLICYLLVGYIVGLGDRHVQNILIDCSTAELVHIDLGMLLRTTLR